MASTASSIFLFTNNFEKAQYNTPAINPMIILAQLSTTEHPAVIATKPLRQPFIAYCKLKLYSPVKCSSTMVERNNVIIHPAAADRVVLIAV